ncbi:MAG: FAD/FMN-dependent dehydrogenase [Acidimicrobiales bacterium]|nr:FAD/FMN-dependent dehydrogenase [Acidimicrobiales bacterium]
MADITGMLSDIVGELHVLTGDAIGDDYTHDEALTARPQRPDWVVRPATTEEVAGVVALAATNGVALTARGSGTGLSGACIPVEGGLVMSFERMAEILEIDLDNHVAVVQPGVTLEQLDDALAEHDLVYPVFPGESSASLGGNVATNAGGMRAVKYGVTRHQVLGLQAVLGTGEVIRTGGKFVKATTGYDLTQLIIGSEGTLAVVTEAILKLYPRPPYGSTLLAPFRTLEEITAAVPRIVASGIAPLMVEYIDLMSMAGITAAAGLDLGIPQEIKDTALAYLVVVLEDRRHDRLDEDTEELAELAATLGALDVYVLPSQAGSQLIEAREQAFWTAKAAGADDIVDMVVPRAAIPAYMAEVSAIAASTASLVVGCGHAGDGNVHLSIFQPDPDLRSTLLRSIFEAGLALGGAISGEHGIGREKRTYYEALEDPNKLALMRRIKAAFDPHDVLNPGTLFS